MVAGKFISYYPTPLPYPLPCSSQQGSNTTTSHRLPDYDHRSTQQKRGGDKIKTKETDHTIWL